MSEAERCSFCLRLPVFRGRLRRAESAVRCPVCKGRLIRAAEQTYREDGYTDSAETRKRRRAPLVYALSCLVALMVAGGLLSWYAAWPVPTSIAVLTQAGPLMPARPLPVIEKMEPPQPPVILTRELPPISSPRSTVATEPPRRERPTHLPHVSSAPVSPRKADQKQPVADSRKPVPTTLENVFYTTDQLITMLRQAPEISLVPYQKVDGKKQLSSEEEDEILRQAFEGTSKKPEKKEDNHKVALKPGEAEWNELRQIVEKDKERSLDSFLARHPEWASLPFQKGKDCQRSVQAAKELEGSTLALQGLLARGSRLVLASGRSGPEADEKALAASAQVLHGLASNPVPATPFFPALEQLLPLELPPARLGLVLHLQFPSDSSDVASFLARRALFDTSADVRLVAAQRLQSMNSQDYLPVLLDGLRYPWAPANSHAADALVALGAKRVVKDLIQLLDAPAPGEPYEIEAKGKKAWAVRELVRLNHRGSCLLCHAPSFAKDDPLRGAVPSPLLPMTCLPYGETGPKALFVRADITYLRQDFSEILPVVHSGRWPVQQRFDFIVREGRLTEKEAEAWRNRERVVGPEPLPASKRAIVYALQKLTGLEGGFTSASWKGTLLRVAK